MSLGSLRRVYWRDRPPTESALFAPALGGSWMQDGLPRLAPLLREFAAQGEGRSGVLLGDGVAPFALPAEVQESDGQVNRLRLKSKAPLYVPRGTLFVGGAQNRMAAEDLAARAGTRDLAVYCVEMGRWDPTATRFGEIRMLPAPLRHAIGHLQGSLADRQAAVWELVAESLALVGSASPSFSATAIVM